MTRMWMVNPKIMCRQHLLGEHKEIHQLIGSLENGRSVKGHIDKGQIDLTQIESRHAVLSVELERRGYNHKSPIELPIANIVSNFSDGFGKVDIDANLKDLLNRCVQCRIRYSNYTVQNYK